MPIYLDYNATTPTDPRVFEKMKPYFCEKFGNPSSQTHSYGWEAHLAVEKARGQVAKSLNTTYDKIIFTSGATESNNLAIMGTLPPDSPKKHFITSQIEHKSVLEVMEALEKTGHEVTYLPVDKYGEVHPKDLKEALQPNTHLISIMMANNEIGTLQPLSNFVSIAKENNILIHTDGAQAVGKIPIHLQELDVDFFSLSGHKMCGPKGIGALYIKKGTEKIHSLIKGGQQEHGLRPGTLNVPGIVGLGEACALAIKEQDEETQRIMEWRDYMIQSILKDIPQARLNGHPTKRLCNNVSLSIENLPCGVHTLGLSELAFSSGSACNSQSTGPSHVLSAIGLPHKLAQATLRLSLGRFTSFEEIQIATQKIIQSLEKVDFKA